MSGPSEARSARAPPSNPPPLRNAKSIAAPMRSNNRRAKNSRRLEKSASFELFSAIFEILGSGNRSGQWVVSGGQLDYCDLEPPLTIHYPLSTIHYPLSTIHSSPLPGRFE